VIRTSRGRVLSRLMIGGVALLVPILAGCEAGDGAPELQFHPAANGAAGTADALTISDAFILGGSGNQAVPAGGSASLFLTVYNGGGSADKLVGIDATGTAKTVQLTGGSVTVPADGSADLEGPKPKVVLRDLSKALTSGTTVTILLSFQNSGSVELTVPVQARDTYYSSYSPPAPTPSATKRVSLGATSPAGATATPSTGTAGVGTSPSPSATAP
jgi:copper(I)-binding protein